MSFMRLPSYRYMETNRNVPIIKQIMEIYVPGHKHVMGPTQAHFNPRG